MVNSSSQEWQTYKVKYSFQNGLSLSRTMLVLLRCNGLLVDTIQYGLMAPVRDQTWHVHVRFLLKKQVEQ